jgi:hypothetical protein
MYRAYKDGIAGTSPKKKGSAPKIQHEFLETMATHAEGYQVKGEGLEAIDRSRSINNRNCTRQLIQGRIGMAQGQDRVP